MKATKFLKNLLYQDPLFGIVEWLSFQQMLPKLKTSQQNGQLKIQLGCGDKLLDGWINIDMRINKQVLTMRLPRGLRYFNTGSVNFIYTSHFLEHMCYPAEAKELLTECHRILAPGGTIRIVVPDIKKIIAAYAQNDQAFFEIQEKMHPDWCTTKLEHLIYTLQLDGHHKYAYDFETLGKLLHQVGFQKVIESTFNQSEIKALQIDYRSRKREGGEYLSLFVEAMK